MAVGRRLPAASPPSRQPRRSDGELVKVKVLFASATNNVPMMVAAENGYWRERGLDVTVQVLDTGSEIATALVTGAADIGAGNATSSVPLSRAAGNDFVLVGPYHNNPLVVAGTERVAIIAGSGLRRPRRRAAVAGRQDRGRHRGEHERELLAGLPRGARTVDGRHQAGEPRRAGHADRALAGQRRRGRPVGAAGQRDHPHHGRRRRRSAARRAVRRERRRRHGHRRVPGRARGRAEAVRPRRLGRGEVHPRAPGGGSGARAALHLRSSTSRTSPRGSSRCTPSSTRASRPARRRRS